MGTAASDIDGITAREHSMNESPPLETKERVEKETASDIVTHDEKAHVKRTNYNDGVHTDTVVRIRKDVLGAAAIHHHILVEHVMNHMSMT